MIKNSKELSVQEAATFLKVKTKQVHRLAKGGKLSKKNIAGKTVFIEESVHKHFVNRNQRIPEGYLSITNAAKNTGLKEDIIRSAIDRKELKTTKHRSGLIIEWCSFSDWVRFLVEKNRILLPLEKKEILRGRIMVKNTHGLHTRPCCDLLKLSLKYQNVDTSLTLCSTGTKAHGEKLLELLALRSAYGDWLKYRIEGCLCKNFLLEMRGLFMSFDKYQEKIAERRKYDLEAFDRDIKFLHF